MDSRKKTAKDAPEGTEEVVGVVNRVVYRSEETGYTVCTIATSADSRPSFDSAGSSMSRMAGKPKDEITVVGNCEALWVGENLKAVGKWVHHRRHGYQFQADQIICIAPVTNEGIKSFLASGMIKGIGKVMAGRLVKKFGDDTLRVIEKESARLEEVEGIGSKRREQIKTSWNEHRAVRDIMIFLRGHGIGTGQAARIYRRYGEDAVAVVSENPYRLCRDVWGIGFKSADKIAMSIGIPRESEVRARAGVLYVLQTMADEGHCFCPREALLEEGQVLLDISSGILDDAIMYGVAQHQLIDDSGNIYLSALYRAEVAIAEKINELFATPLAFKQIDTDRAIPWSEQKMEIAFADEQRRALQVAMSEKVSIITGGPGVGKTTIVKALVDVFKQRKLNVVMAAPTGRAAKRMAEATGFEAKTIHRLLKFQPALGGFEHGAGNPLEGDVFILDEASMIDLLLMNSFLAALKPESNLVLVGDSDQLPSVGPGNVLKDMIASGSIPSCRLDHIFRQKSRSWIVHNAHRINHGEKLEEPGANDESDFYFIKSDSPEDTIARTMELVTQRIPDKFGFDARTEIQVLTPMRKNQLGADNLNELLQSSLNPHGVFLTRFGRTYRVGDRVMQIRNNYDKDIFNGDIGIITDVDLTEQIVTVSIDGRPITYDYSDLDELVLAYACTIHKSQGSEYPCAVILLSTQHFKLLQRNLLYTAVTRGRKLVCLVGSHKAVFIAVKNNKTILRRTSLARRISGRHMEE